MGAVSGFDDRLTACSRDEREAAVMWMLHWLLGDDDALTTKAERRAWARKQKREKQRRQSKVATDN